MNDSLLNRLTVKAKTDGVAQAYPPLDLKTVEACEKWFGFKLPEILKRIYTEVSNGGIGPGGGLLGLAGGKRSSFNQPYTFDVLGIYDAFINFRFGWDEQDDYGNNLWEWPLGLLPICDWGDFELTTLDCKTRNDAVLRVNYRNSINYKTAFKQKSPDVFRRPGTTLESWLESSFDQSYTRHIPESANNQTQDQKHLELPPRPIVQVRNGRLENF